jgi:hypothetical protein
MNTHFEAQTVLESLHWLRENRSQIDLPTALLIQAAEDPWIDVMEAAKLRTTTVARAATPEPAVLTPAAAQSPTPVKPEASAAQKTAAPAPKPMFAGSTAAAKRKLAGM